jgi:predicted ATPase
VLEKHVLTGGPGVGKTTVLLELEKLGHCIVPESARMVIAEEQQKLDGDLPWTKPYEFQCRVVDRQLELEQRVHGDGQAFLDRGLIDVLAFHRHYRIPMPPELPFEARKREYATIFFFDTLPSYRTDAQRKEKPEQARAIHDLIAQTYRELGYGLVRVPVLEPKERAQYIIDYVTNGGVHTHDLQDPGRTRA